MVEKRIWEANHRCPVCGRYVFDYENDLDMCVVCGWSNDYIQGNYSDTHYTTQQTLGSPSRARRMAEKG